MERNSYIVSTGLAILFSVLRLCGSRQVVAHCCADWTNYANAYTISLFGGSKVKQGPLSPKSCKPSQRNNNRNHNTKKHTEPKNTKQPSKKPQRGLDMTAPIDCSINCLQIKRSCAWNKEETQNHRARSCEDVQQNTPPSSAETQDPPCQDPGDRTEEPSGMRHLRNRRRPCSELQSWLQPHRWHPTVWGTRPKTTAWNDRRGETDAQQNSLAHYSRWCNSTASLTLAQTPHQRRGRRVSVVDLTGRLSLTQQECQLLLFDCVLDCIGISLEWVWCWGYPNSFALYWASCGLVH